MPSWSSVDVTESKIKFEPNYFPENRAEIVLDKLLQQYFSVALYKQYNLVKSTAVRPSLSDSLLPSSGTTGSSLIDTSCVSSIVDSLDSSIPYPYFVTCPENTYFRHKRTSRSHHKSRRTSPVTRRIRELSPHCIDSVSPSPRSSSVKRHTDNPSMWYPEGNHYIRVTRFGGSPHNVKRQPWLHGNISRVVLVSSREGNSHNNQHSPVELPYHHGIDESTHGIPNDRNRSGLLNQYPPFSPFRQSNYQVRSKCSPGKVKSSGIASNSGWKRISDFSQHCSVNSSMNVASPAYCQSSNNLPLFRNNSPRPACSNNQYHGSPVSSPSMSTRKSALTRDGSQKDNFSQYTPFPSYQSSPSKNPCNTASFRDGRRNPVFGQYPPLYPYGYQKRPGPSPRMNTGNSTVVCNGSPSHPSPRLPSRPCYPNRPEQAHRISVLVSNRKRNDHLRQKPLFAPPPFHGQAVCIPGERKLTLQSAPLPHPSCQIRGGDDASQSLTPGAVLHEVRKRRHPNDCPEQVNPDAVSGTPESQQKWN